ncbi:MAG: ATPase [Hyphomonadaceae bacterium]|nr:ATPase [Hyphomonadaceae bacterium]
MIKRFYTEVSVEAGEGGFAVKLDGRLVKTPTRNLFVLPTLALAEACAGEWEAQGEEVRPESMPLTKLANVAIDRTPEARGAMIGEIAKYGETDLICHRADAPAALVEKQAAAWDPWLAWSQSELRFAPACVTGIVAAPNDIAPLAEAAEALDDFRLTALARGVALAGSAVLGFALLRGALEPDAAFRAAALDELFQVETWGDDEEARARLVHTEEEFHALAAFVAALEG